MNNKAHNKSLHWIFIPLRSIKTSEFNRSPDAARPANGAADVHPLVVDALCAPPNKRLQPTVAPAGRCPPPRRG